MPTPPTKCWVVTAAELLHHEWIVTAATKEEAEEVALNGAPVEARTESRLFDVQTIEEDTCAVSSSTR